MSRSSTPVVSFGVSVPEAVGDASSFEAFFEAESASLFRRLCLVTGNRHEAEEVSWLASQTAPPATSRHT